MKLQPEKTVGLNIFTAYGEGYVSVNAVRHTANLIVLPERLITDWTKADFAALSTADSVHLVSSVPRPWMIPSKISPEKGSPSQSSASAGTTS